MECAQKSWNKINSKRKQLNESKWKKQNPTASNLRYKRYRDRILSTPKGVLNNRMSVAIWQSVKENKEGRSWEELVGYTLNDLKNHLERLLNSEMNWKKLLGGDIHIDHIKPKSLFNYSSFKDKEFKECWSLSNLQPLERGENLRKYNHY